MFRLSKKKSMLLKFLMLTTAVCICSKIQ